MVGRTLKMAFWVVYDHLGKLLVANLLCMAALLAPASGAYAALTAPHLAVQLLLGVPLAALALFGVVPAATVGLAHLAKQLLDTRDGALTDVLDGVRAYGRRAAGLGLLYVAALGCLGTSGWFYPRMLRESAPWLGFGLSALALWAAAFITLMALMAVPALVQKKEGVWPTVKLSAALVLDNPLFAFGLACQFAALAAVSVVLTPLLVFLSWSGAAVLGTAAYEQLARRYALIEATRAGVDVGKDGAPLAGFAAGVRMVERDGVLVVDDEHDDYLNRGFRDFVFPWKS